MKRFLILLVSVILVLSSVGCTPQETEIPKVEQQSERFREYSDIINAFDDLWLSENCGKSEEELYKIYGISDSERDREIFDALHHMSSFDCWLEYAEQDINEDEIPELFIIKPTDHGNCFVYAVFTTVDNLPKLVKGNGSCRISKFNEVIITNKTADPEDWDVDVYELSTVGELLLKFKFGRIYGTREHYKIENGVRKIITEDEFSTLLDLYAVVGCEMHLGGGGIFSSHADRNPNGK